MEFCSSYFGGHYWSIGTLIFLIVLSVFGYWLIRGNGKKRSTGNHGQDREDSLEILKFRLARGDITVEDFKILKSHL